MPRHGLHLGLYALLLLTLVTALPAAAQGPLQDFEGNPRSVDEFTGDGKWTVVMFWASDCEICNREMRHYVDFQARHSDRNIRMLGISTDGRDGRAEARAFIERHDVNFSNLIGDPHAVAAWFTELTGAGWIGTPTFMIYNPQGTLVAQQIGAAPVPLIENFIRDNSQ